MAQLDVKRRLFIKKRKRVGDRAEPSGTSSVQTKDVLVIDCMSVTGLVIEIPSLATSFHAI